MGYVIVCEKGLVVMQEYATPEQAERARDAVAALENCAWRHDIATVIAENGIIQFAVMHYPARRQSA